MTRRWAVLAALALLIAVAFVAWWSRRVAPAAGSGGQQTSAPAPASAPLRPGASDISATVERSTLADMLNSPATSIHADVRLVSEIIETFRTNFPKDGNPAGNNADITAALTGKNRLRLALIPPDHPAINAGGELCDRWGTPFFFHAESGTRMEIRSAGPDRRMWTDDDVLFAP